jgi:uncharacterized protein (DUF952 family)
MMRHIYHITPRDAWAAAQEKGEYTADSLAEQGFIHCSERSQITRVANAIFRGRTDLVLLEIDPDLLKAEVRREPGTDEPGELFPHIYGPLAPEAVLRTLDFPPNPDGRFTLPQL